MVPVVTRADGLRGKESEGGVCLRQLIFILGMGRSGTSAITRVLSLCGGTLPEPLLGSNEGNPTGHWEPLDALKLNEAFLQRRGSNWYDPRLWEPDQVTVDSSEERTFVDRIATFLECHAGDSPLLVKEPRITALTPFWFEAARRLGLRIAVVIAIRHPAEVAASVAARDGVPIELSNALWLKYNYLSEQRSRELPRVLVEYPNLIADWKREVRRVARALAIDLSSTQDREIDAFLSPDLRHQRASMDIEDVPGSINEKVYAILSRASRDGDLAGSEIERLVDAYMSTTEARVAIEQFAGRFSPAGVQDRAVTAGSC